MSSVPLRTPTYRINARPRGADDASRRDAPRLKVVRAPARQRARAPFVLLCVGILSSALLGALLLNTSMAQTSFDIHDRQVELARLTEQQQDLAQDLAVAASPGSLAVRAREAGMVPASPPAFVRLSDGAIIGESIAARAAG